MRRTATAKVLVTGALLAALLGACGTEAANAPAPAGTAVFAQPPTQAARR